MKTFTPALLGMMLSLHGLSGCVETSNGTAALPEPVAPVAPALPAAVPAAPVAIEQWELTLLVVCPQGAAMTKTNCIWLRDEYLPAVRVFRSRPLCDDAAKTAVRKTAEIWKMDPPVDRYWRCLNTEKPARGT